MGVIQASSVFADDNSARRYAALDRDAVTCRYFLLSTKQVQDSLKLTQQQIDSIKLAMSSSPTNDPAIAEYHHSHKKLLKTAHSDEERAKIRREGNEKYSLLIEQYLETTLQGALSSSQTKRLDELLLQMKGPHAILENTNAIRDLKLSKAQISQLNDISNSYSQLLSLLRQRFLGLQIQPVRNRDRADLDSEIQSLVRVIREVEKDRDVSLLAALSEEQRHSWENLRGAPVSIDWKLDCFSDTPFQVEN